MDIVNTWSYSDALFHALLDFTDTFSVEQYPTEDGRSLDKKNNLQTSIDHKTMEHSGACHQRCSLVETICMAAYFYKHTSAFYQQN